MKIIRVFVSSPGDVQAERTIADRLIRATAEELGIPISVQYSNLLRSEQPISGPDDSSGPESSDLILCPYFWEYQRFSAEKGYQDQIPNPAQFDLVVCILWSRLGTSYIRGFGDQTGWRARAKSEFVLESDSAPKSVNYQHYRCEETFRALVDWLKAKGVQGNKPLHALRKLYGSALADLHGLHAASSGLRHADIRTTSAFYADRRVKVTPGFGSAISGALVMDFWLEEGTPRSPSRHQRREPQSLHLPPSRR